MSRSLSLSVPVAQFVNTPSAGPGVTPTGGVAGHYTYKLVAIGADSTHSAASTGTAITNGPTSLDDTHYNTIDQTGITAPGAVSYDVYRTAGGTTQGKIGNIPADGSTTLRDNGLAGDAATAPSTNTSGIGAAVGVGDMADLTVEIEGTFVATLQVQGEIDGGSGTFVNIGSTLNAPGIVDVSATAKSLSQIRVQVTAYTSGTPTAAVAGH